MNIIFQSIKQAPRLVWQAAFQPSKANSFIQFKKLTDYFLIILSLGLLCGGLLAIPHYYLYHNLTQSVLFAFAFSVAVAVAGEVAVTGEAAVTGAYIANDALGFAFIITFAGIFAVAGTGKIAVASATAFSFVLVCGFENAALYAAFIVSDMIFERGKTIFKSASEFIALTVLFAFTFTGALSFAGAGIVSFAGACAGALAGLFAGKGSIAGTVATATTTGAVWLFPMLPPMFISITIPELTIGFNMGFPILPLPPVLISIILLLSAIFWFIIFQGKTDLWLFIIGCLLMLFAGGGTVPVINSYETIIFSLSFFISYFFISQVYFFNTRKGKITHQRFEIIQKTSLIWGPLLGFLMYLFILFNIKPELHVKISITATGFAIMPIFILHIPDYLLSLPLWHFQRIRASKNYEHTEKLIYFYENSILFKHEMLYFQLPGLHKFISLFARNKELGIKDAVKRINHLHLFTFQHKQAQKAIIQLGKDKHTAHKYIHFLLEENNIPLVTTLSKTNRLAELYLILSDNTEQKQHKKESSYSLSFTVEKGLFSRMRQKRQKQLPETLEDKISHVCLEMVKEQNHRFNDEIIKSLESAHKFLTSKNLKDFYEAYYTPHPVPKDGEIKYLTDIQTLFSGLKKINNNLPKIETIEKFVTRREFLYRLKQAFETLSKKAEQTFYEPFASIWKNAMLHFAGVIEQEINVQQGSATLFIELKNKEILLSEQERILYFEISNKGQELAQDISIEIQADSPAVSFSNTTADIQVIESGTIKEVSFPINADSPINTVIRGNITFSDRTSDNKTLPFSFPIAILEETAVFHEIHNPYIAGNPITEKSPLYFGRQDAYDYIDKNIITGNEHHTIVCHGLRRTGKSSLLYKILENGFTDKRLVPVYFDIQSIDDEKDFYNELSYRIIENISSESYTNANNFGEFKSLFRSVKSNLPDKIIVLLIDEFEELQMRVEDGKISKNIFSNIRHLMQHEEKLIFLFCGTHKLEEMSADYWSIFFNTAMYLKISYLSKKHTAELITKPVKDQLAYDNLAVEQIYKMTHGQPYLTQLLCRTLVNDLNENKKRNYAGINDVDDATQKIITQGDDHFSAHIWKKSDTLERLLLSAAAEELTHKQLDFISFGDLYNKISLVKAYPKKECADTLGRLVTKDILMDKEGRYSFPVNLLRKWVSEKHPPRLVREEIERK